MAAAVVVVVAVVGVVDAEQFAVVASEWARAPCPFVDDDDTCCAFGYSNRRHSHKLSDAVDVETGKHTAVVVVADVVDFVAGHRSSGVVENLAVPHSLDDNRNRQQRRVERRHRVLVADTWEAHEAELVGAAVVAASSWAASERVVPPCTVKLTCQCRTQTV